MALMYVTGISTHHASEIFPYVEVVKAVELQVGSP